MQALFARWVFGRTGGARVPLLSWPLALLIVIAVHAVSLVELDQLTFNNSAEAYYPTDAPAVLLRDQLREDFPSDEVLTVLFKGDQLFGKDFLGRLDRVALALKANALVDRVITVATVEHISGSEEGFSVSPLVDVRKLTGQSPESVRDRVLADRFAPGGLVSRDGRYMAMVVRPKPLGKTSERLEVTVAVARAINEAGLRPFYAGEAGPVTMDVAQLDSILSDSTRFVPMTVAVALALLFWVVGRWRPVVIGGMAISTVVVATLAGVAASGRPYTMASAILPSLLSAYTVVTLLHLYAGIQRAQRHCQDRVDVVDTAVLETLKPGFFNVVTTSAGLLGLLLVPIPPIQVFGVAGAVGTLVVFLVVYGLVPPFLRSWDRKPWPVRGGGLGLLGKASKRLATLSLRWPKSVLVGFVAFLLAFFPLLGRVQVETDFLKFFPDEHPINVSTRAIETNLTGVSTLEISLRAESRDAFQRVEVLRQVKQLQDWLDAQPEVTRSSSMVDAVEEMHWAMNREREGFRTVPPTDRLLRQYLLVYDGTDLYELVNRDFQHARIILNLNVHGTKATGQVIDRVRAHLQAQPLAGLQADVGGYGRLLSDQVDLLISGQTGSFVGTFVQVYLMMLLLWRAPVASGLCMVPNLAPLFFIFVLMGWQGIALDSSTVMIASVVLGITVDDTIHLHHGVLQRLAAGASPVFAIARSYEAIGRAVLATAAILIGQFLLLAGSEFKPTANFGLMTATALAAGLVFELLLLPALLLLWYGRGDRQRGVHRRRLAIGAASTGSHAAKFGDSVVPSRAPLAASHSESKGHELPPGSAQPGRHHVLVCQGEQCRRGGAAVLWRSLRAEQQRLIDQGQGGRIHLTKTGCLGPCRYSPVLQIYPQGSVYGPLEAEDLARVIEGHIRHNQPVQDLIIDANALADAPPRR